MKVRIPEYYNEFKCIAGECTDTCCAGWQVDVDDRSYAYYKTIQGEFGDRLHSVMVDGKKGCEGQFKIRPDGRCPFLNDHNLCDLYAELGEEALCKTCDEYPRFTTEYGNLKEIGLALSCKTAAELILQDRGKPSFIVYEDSDSYPSLNNIDGNLYLQLNKARSAAIELVCNRKFSIPERLLMLLDFGKRLQKNIKKPEKFNEIIAKMLPRGRKLVKHTKPMKDATTINMYRCLWHLYLRRPLIEPELANYRKMAEEELFTRENVKHTEMAYHLFYTGKIYEYENILVYFIYRYFLKGCIDKDVLSKVKLIIINTLMIIHCDMALWMKKDFDITTEDQIEIVHLISREVEHSEEKLAGLYRNFKYNPVFSVKVLKKFLPVS